MKDRNHYLYQHIRLDKNEVFYIGIGTKSIRKVGFKTTKKEYQRAYNTLNRVGVWKNIVSKTDYRIEILEESNDYNYICQREIELVKQYGRIDQGSGCLANLTDGGEGTPGLIKSEKFKESARIRIAEARKFNRCNREYVILNTLTGIYYETIKEIVKLIEGFSESHIRNMLLGRNPNKTPFKII